MTRPMTAEGPAGCAAWLLRLNCAAVPTVMAHRPRAKSLLNCGAPAEKATGAEYAARRRKYDNTYGMAAVVAAGRSVSAFKYMPCKIGV